MQLKAGQLLQFHSDGGCRSESAGAGFTVTLIHNVGPGEVSREVLLAVGVFLGPLRDSLLAELMALDLAFDAFLRIHNEGDNAIFFQ